MKRILVVEDNPLVLEGLLDLLSQTGAQVVGVTDGTQAMDLIRNDRIDLLITDLDLPGETGLELVSKAKAYRPEMDTILVTGFGCSAVRKMVRDVELSGYFEKPYDPAALLRMVKASLIEGTESRKTRLGNSISAGEYSNFVA